jgi:hypothetical protein
MLSLIKYLVRKMKTTALNLQRQKEHSNFLLQTTVSFQLIFMPTVLNLLVSHKQKCNSHFH